MTTVFRERQKPYAKLVIPPPQIEISIGWAGVNISLEEARKLQSDISAAFKELEPKESNNASNL